MLLLIDFEKAFDSIEWSYIRKVLHKYNFGEDFIKWFNIVYKNSQSCVINNGIYSQFFKLDRGCRQGDPWSPYLFILAIEPLSLCIKYDQNITGIKIGPSEIKIGQYADDTFLILDGSEIATKGALQILNNFEKVSGLRINVDKTQVIKLGQTNNNPICPVLNVPYSQTFKLLGINFSTNLDEINDLNFRDKITHIHKIVKLYQWRNLSMAGRITIVKMHILPKLVHLLAVLPTPKQEYLQEINTVLSQFVWNKKRPKIQMNTLVQDYKMGGQKMLHLDTFCKASKLSWINKIYKSSDTTSWKSVAIEVFQEKFLPMVFEGSIERIKLMKNKMNNMFWKEVLETWLFYRAKTENNNQNEQIPNTVMWNSNLIRNDNLLRRRNEFMEKGLTYFKNLFNYETKEFRSRQNLKDNFNINITAFDYMCLLQSIPKRHKLAIKTYSSPATPNQFGNLVKDLCSRTKICNYTYNVLIKQLPHEIKSLQKWEVILSKPIDEQEWQSTFMLPKTITLDSQLQIFQYKIVHRILPSNKLLYMYNIRDNPWCKHCDNTVEDLEHLFHLCPTKLSLWYDMAIWLFPEIDLFQYINTENIMFGIYNDNKVLENSVIMIIKRYIYINKCFDKDTNRCGAILYMNHIMNLEINVRCSRRQVQNLRKWSPLEIKIQTGSNPL